MVSRRPHIMISKTTALKCNGSWPQRFANVHDCTTDTPNKKIANCWPMYSAPRVLIADSPVIPFPGVTLFQRCSDLETETAITAHRRQVEHRAQARARLLRCIPRWSARNPHTPPQIIDYCCSRCASTSLRLLVARYTAAPYGDFVRSYGWHKPGPPRTRVPEAEGLRLDTSGRPLD